MFLTFSLPKKEKAHPAYVSKHNSNCEKQAILLIIPNGEGSHYLAVKKRVIKRNKVKKPQRFLLSELRSFFTSENKGESYKKVCENFCNAVMAFEYTKLLEFNQY